MQNSFVRNHINYVTRRRVSKRRLIAQGMAMFTDKTNTPETLSAHPKVHLLARQLTPPKGLETTNLNGFELQCLQHWTMRAQHDIAIAGLLKLWAVAKQLAQNGVIAGADLSWIDAVVNYPGFGIAMEKVGWIHYDRKRNCLTLPEIESETLKVEAKKSPGARRQKAYRERLKMKNCLTRGITADYVARCNSVIRRRERAVVIPRLIQYENGVTHYGSMVIEGVSYEVTSTPLSSYPGVTHNAPSVTQGITRDVTHNESGITRNVTNDVTKRTADGAFHPAQAAAEAAGAGGSDTQPHVTQRITLSASDITDSVTRVDSDVTQGVTDPAQPSRVIPSRAHTRLSFLRSKRFKSKPKTTHKTPHSAREENFWPVDNHRADIPRFPAQRPWHPGNVTDSTRQRGGYSHRRIARHQINAMFNVTQSLTLVRHGQGSACLTRIQSNRGTQQQPDGSKTFRDVFPMFPSWKPSDGFLSVASQLSINLTEGPGDAELKEFIGYWSAGKAQHTQQQWEFKLARCLNIGRKRAHKRAEALRDITIMPSADYEIPEGFRGG